MQHSHPTEDAFMVPGMGAQPVPPPKYNPANDNKTYPVGYVPPAEARAARGLYIGLARPGDPNGCADDLVTTTFAPLEELPYVGDIPGENKKSHGWTRVDNLIDRAAKAAVDAAVNVVIEDAVAKTLPLLWDAAGTYTGPSARHGDWMQTYTGKQFWPMDPRANEVDIRDIAHSLSLQCRYAGHCRRFYSVAEHSVHIARWLVDVDKDAALWGLLHDASEAYLVDVPRPVKPSLVGYKAAEAKVMAAICERFGLPLEMPAVVHEADDRIIADELVNLVSMAWHARHDDPLGVALQFWSPAEAEEEFIETFKALAGEGW